MNQSVPDRRLDGIRRIDHFADVRWISEERGKIRPVSLPASAYLRIATVPGSSERFQCLLTFLFRGSLINRFQVASDSFVVGATLMELKWTSKALSDLAQLYDFLVLASKSAAARTVQSLTQALVILLTHPHMGEQLFQFEPREVRRIFAGEYEIRYELTGQIIYVLRLWHIRENR